MFNLISHSSSLPSPPLFNAFAANVATDHHHTHSVPSPSPPTRPRGNTSHVIMFNVELNSFVQVTELRRPMIHARISPSVARSAALQNFLQHSEASQNLTSFPKITAIQFEARVEFKYLVGYPQSPRALGAQWPSESLTQYLVFRRWFHHRIYASHALTISPQQCRAIPAAAHSSKFRLNIWRFRKRVGGRVPPDGVWDTTRPHYASAAINKIRLKFWRSREREDASEQLRVNDASGADLAHWGLYLRLLSFGLLGILGVVSVHYLTLTFPTFGTGRLWPDGEIWGEDLRF
ncbi:hypothetical protein DFH06DRAFT_1337640 [Mycena polygramma]|nr:hypothetical protein DFH06DRAFT_1337640 [Mycena polygramma]